VLGCSLPPLPVTPSPLDGIVGTPVIAAVAVAPSARSADTLGPSLDETTTFLIPFMQATVNRYGPSSDKVVIRSGRSQDVSSRLEIARFNHCVMMFSSRSSYRDIAVNLQSLDPVSVRPGPDADGSPTLRLETTGRLRTILAYESGALRNGIVDSVKTRPWEGWNAIVLVLRDRDGGERIKRALTRAMQLCGARGAPF